MGFGTHTFTGNTFRRSFIPIQERIVLRIHFNLGEKNILVEIHKSGCIAKRLRSLGKVALLGFMFHEFNNFRICGKNIHRLQQRSRSQRRIGSVFSDNRACKLVQGFLGLACCRQSNASGIGNAGRILQSPLVLLLLHCSCSGNHIGPCFGIQLGKRLYGLKRHNHFRRRSRLPWERLVQCSYGRPVLHLNGTFQFQERSLLDIVVRNGEDRFVFILECSKLGASFLQFVILERFQSR